jgi:CHAT domain-containing protein/tetratricopeptide (TPR) repeat protein
VQSVDYVIRSAVGTIGFAVVLVAGAAALSGVRERARVVSPDVRALLAAGLYEQAEAAARDDVDKLRASQGDDALPVATASDVLVRALILNGRGTHDQTRALATHTLRSKEAHLGTGHPDLVPSLLNLGDVLAEGAEFEQAIAVTQRAVTLREGSAGRDSLDVAEALDHLGGALSAARHYDDALKVLDRSLGVKEKALDGSDVNFARTLEDKGLVLQRKGAYDRAGVPLRRAAAIQEAAGIDHPAYARTLNLIAQQLWFEGQLIESRNISERAVSVAERTLRPDHPMVALSLRYLAATLEDLGDTGRSLALKERALAIAERNFGASHHVTAEYLHTLAAAELHNGAYATARQRFQRALSIYEARYGRWHEYVATTLSILARTDASLGDYASARRELGRAVAIHEHVGGPNHPYVAFALTELSTVYREQGSPAEALPLLARALAIREKSLGPDHRDVARTLADMASTLMQTGQTTRAQAAATRALDIWGRLDAPDAPEYATVLMLYGELQANRGDSAAARDYYERALTIRGKVFGASNPVYADAQSRLALTLADLGARGSALSTAVSAEATGREHLRLMLRSLPERQALNYAAARPRALNLILSLTRLTSEAAVFALDGLIRSRALVLDEMAARQSAGRTGTENADSFRVALRSAQQRLANLVVRGPDQLSPAQYTTLVDSTRRESEEAEQALAGRSAEFRAERGRAQLGLEEVRSSLAPDSALVSFVRYDRALFGGPVQKSAPNGPARSSSRTVPSYLAFVLRAHQAPAVVPLGSARTIDPLVAQWRADIAAEAVAPSQTPTGASSPSSRVSGVAVRRLVWDPLALHLGDASRVFIVPDGALSLVPFVALPVGQRSYLLERAPLVHYLSAERDLVPAPVDTASVGHGLLALGGPAFDDPTLFTARRNRPASVAKLAAPTASVRAAGTPCGSFQAITFQPLEGTLQEVRELSSLWSTPAIPNAERARVLVGRDASEPTFKREAHSYRVLHLATHGFFLSDACLPGTSGTRGVGGLSTKGRVSAAMRAENPLLLSGLALAGANRRAAAGPNEDDGILTAEEVTSMNLEGVEWAVLSACDTGVGEVKAGEGVFGLRRAFQVAGARTVIMSLWSVDDQAARAWMRALYEGRFQKRLTTADAVHAASVAVLQDRRAKGRSTSPFYWAAFVAAGDWR